MSEEQLPRKISRSEFMTLINLVGSQPWLQRVESALLDLLEFCDSQEDIALVSSLLIRTTSMTDSEFTNAISTLGTQIESNWLLDPKKTWLVSSNSKGNTDSSQEVLNRLKSYAWKSLDWRRDRFLTRYKEVESKLSSGDCVVIVDDFVGTGRSMIKTIDWFKASLAKSGKRVRLTVAVVAGCKSGIEELKKQSLDVFATCEVDKSISDFYSGPDLAKARDRMRSLEDKLAVDVRSASFENYRFGYGSSEAMYRREGGNTPNNVFPLFWWRPIKSGARQVVMHRT